MVRHYWTKVQDVLGIYPEEGKNIRLQTELRAREEGLIDLLLPPACRPSKSALPMLF
jgi:hypothetical protein